MTSTFVANDKTHDNFDVIKQPDGPGLRYGKRGEATAVAKLVPGGAAILRQRIGQFQAESRYYEGRIGTVHELRVILINNDTQALVTVTYDGDFKPYLTDIVREAGVWFDGLMPGVWEGYDRADSPATQKLIIDNLVTAEMFYVCHHDLSVKDIARLKKLGVAVANMLDAAS